MRRLLLVIVLLTTALLAVGIYFANTYWIHRFDDLIERQAKVYQLDKDLVWSIIYQETYFRPEMLGADKEVGLMQITPMVAQTWAKETGIKDLERQISEDHTAVLREPERNIQIGCWYLESLRENFRDTPEWEARVLAAYNAGLSRSLEWNKSPDGKHLTEEEFINRIDIPSTRAYVSQILRRYKSLKK